MLVKSHMMFFSCLKMSTTTKKKDKKKKLTLFSFLISDVKDNVLLCSWKCLVNQFGSKHQHNGISSIQSPPKLNKTITIIMFHKSWGSRASGGLLQKELRFMRVCIPPFLRHLSKLDKHEEVINSLILEASVWSITLSIVWV